MAILVNLGKRGFVLKEGLLNPGQTLTVDQETANTLSKMYPKELKVIIAEAPKVEVVKQEPIKEEPKAEEVKEAAVEEPTVEEPKKKRTYKRKAK